MRDRFGALPPNVENLFHFVRVKWFAKQLGVLSIVREGARGVMKLTPHAKIDPNKLLMFISENPQAKFSPNGVLSFPLREHGPEVIGAVEQKCCSDRRVITKCLYRRVRAPNFGRMKILTATALLLLSLALSRLRPVLGRAGSTGAIDESSTSLYEFHNGTLRFESGQTGTIVARYPLGNTAVENPDFNTLVVSYGGPGVSAKLVNIPQCGGTVEEVASWGPSTTTSANTCDNIDVSSVYWDNYGYSWYVEVTLTRTSTSTNPQFHHAQLIP